MIELMSPDGIVFDFECQDFKEGVPIAPKLPANFSDTPNGLRPQKHLAWWLVPFIELDRGERMGPDWLKHWPSGTRYDVRCLDGGAWDRPTCWGMFASLQEALECAKKGPAWLHNVT